MPNKKDKSKSGSKGHREHKHSSKPSESREGQAASPFMFRDRSGKVHVIGQRPGAARPGAEDRKQLGAPKQQPAASRTFLPHELDKSEAAARKHHRGRPEKSGKFDKPRGHERGGQKWDQNRAATPGQRRRFEREHAPLDAEGATLRGSVDKNRKGFAFISFVDRKIEDVFVPPHWADKVFHGDRVEVTVDHRGELKNLKVLEHRFREIVGRFEAHPTRSDQGWVVYERKRAREEVFVPSVTLGARTGQWVRCGLEFHEEGPFTVTGSVLDVYGEELPATADVGMIAAEYGLVEEHSKEAEAEARSFHLEIPGRDLDGREDLRHVPFITIDGETARDFDDAVYVERRKSGYRLWVAIADVSHYVTPSTALDREALSRGTSVYFPERAFHMLPHALSTHLCSLRPKEPRLAMVCWIDYDRNGRPQDVDVMEAVIESKRRATYTEIAAEFAELGKDPHWQYKPHFELYQLIRKTRSDRGSIDFDLPEADVLVDAQGEPQSIENRERNDAHRLIEEFMIAANEAVTRWMMEMEWPFVYRIHDQPSLASLQKFEALAATVGIHVDLTSAEVDPRTLAEIVRKVQGHAAQDLINMAMLRSLKQAIYSATHGIHYGLASEAYTHFTSPIRRYPDLVVHRLIRWALDVKSGKLKSLKKHEREELEEELAEVAEHCSYRERVAAEADREATRLKQVRFMKKRLGEQFEAKVIGVSETGLFMMIPDPYVEGLVPKDSLLDDFFEFNEDKMILFGRRTRKSYRIGDRLMIQVIRADLDRRQIDFALAEHAEAVLRTMPAGGVPQGREVRDPWSSRGGGPRDRGQRRPGKDGKRSGGPNTRATEPSGHGKKTGQKRPRRRSR
jgi:ribonuclease R